MIAARTGNDYTKITKIFAGGSVQQEIIKVWSTDANAWVYEMTDTAAGTLPLTFHADGSPTVNYKIYGDASGVGVWDSLSRRYKLDMVSSDGTNDVTTSIYIGREPLWAVGNYADIIDYNKQKITRYVKKYVLTGTEEWEEVTGAFPTRTYFRWLFVPIRYHLQHICTCSHLNRASVTTSNMNVGFDVFDSTSANSGVLAIRPENVTSVTLADFKAWLAEQYAAGTPVTVWCTLTTAEDTDPPAPIPALPTFGNADTVLDYEDTPAPRRVAVRYKKGL